MFDGRCVLLGFLGQGESKVLSYPTFKAWMIFKKFCTFP